MKGQREFDLICMGRAAVDLYSDQFGAQLEEVSSFSKYLGGCPANIAVGTARLGLRSAMLTRVGDEAMGRFVRETLASEGVDTQLVTTDQERLTGLVLLGVLPPDQFPLIFYRENCADMALSSEDFSADDIGKARALLVTGTHFSREGVRQASLAAIERAKSVGTRVIVDIDFRPVLWGLSGHGEGEERYVSSTAVSEAFSPIWSQCDLIVGTEEELRIAAGTEDIDEALRILQDHAPGAVIVRKRGAEGSLAYAAGARDPSFGAHFPVEALNVLGAGDGFLSGFLRGWLRGETLSMCCQWGNACGAIVVSRHGCSVEIPYWNELQMFLGQETKNISALAAVHRHLGKKEIQFPLQVLAVDHRDLFRQLESDQASVQHFKDLAVQALVQEHQAGTHGTLGVILDGEYGEGGFSEAVAHGLWNAKCIEKTASFPVEFLRDLEPSEILRHWPRSRVVKVLTYALDLLDMMRSSAQVRQLRALQRACQTWGHELLIEVIPARGQSSEDVAITIEHYHALNIWPSWWKLPVSLKEEEWDLVDSVVEEQAPSCRGVLVLGGEHSLESLEQMFLQLESWPTLRGFAVGRAVWQDVAQRWLAHEITDADVVREVAARFSFLCEAWSREAVMV